MAREGLLRFDPDVLRFLVAPRFAALATVDPTGAPHHGLVWYRLESDHTLLVNSAVGRRWPTDLLRDPRCSLIVSEGTRWVAIRAEAEALPREQGLDDILALLRRYEGDGPGTAAKADVFRGEARISFRLRPTAISVHL